MKNLITILLFFLTLTALQAQVSYQSHRVEKGETVFGIAQKYNISEDELLLLNPEAKTGLKENSVLIIPVKVEAEIENGLRFEEHKVKRRETLFSISQQYGVSIDNIKKYNKHLYSNETLKRNEILKIPVGAVVITSTVVEVKEAPDDSQTGTTASGKHTVQAKETKFGIAKMYGITIEELERVNPVISDTNNLPVGLVLNIPVPKAEEEIEAEEGFILYEVQPKEGFFRLKTMFGLTQAEIIALNPHTKDGLKEGMILKIPKTTDSEEITTTTVDNVSIEYSIEDRTVKNIVLLLPFQLNSIAADTLATPENKIINDASLRVALDMYAGALMAVEAAKEKGISVNLHVFDSQDVERGATGFFNQKNVKNIDAVIGPLRQASVEKVASDLERQNIPVISPLSNRQGRAYKNYVHSITSSTLLENEMIAYLKTNSNGKNIVLISDNTKTTQRQRLQSALPGMVLISPREGNYFRTEDIANKMDASRENWVILESSNVSVVSSAIGILNSVSRNSDIRLFTTDRNDAFSFGDVSNLHLANLNFTFPSVSKSYSAETLETEVGSFPDAYKEKYGTLPNRFAIRGFDVTYDTLLRLAHSGTIFKAFEAVEGATEYTENKFFYVKNPQGGYVNTAFYILKYNQNLELEVVQ